MSHKIAYFYKNGIGDYLYKPGHPMKPQRIKLTHHLLLSYQLYQQMEVYEPHIATSVELAQFHSPDYLQFLEKVTPANYYIYHDQLDQFLANPDDNPIFRGMYEFCQQYTGASIDAAIHINHKLNDICVNWSGGLHHAKKLNAWGFCYVNDIVLCILELLKYNARVMYIDIDIHHGDGVEEAFYDTDRVMTISFHKYGNYFPGTGNNDDIGTGKGKHYALNIPLSDGIDDETYASLFRPIVFASIQKYSPNAIVLQCGADSITGDMLGTFNMTLQGHGKCVSYVKSFNIPMIVLGGGGYTMRNVARCWTYETGVLLGKELSGDIPENEYMNWFEDGQLYLTPDPEVINMNTKDAIAKLLETAYENLSHQDIAPSVQMQSVPPDFVRHETKEAPADDRNVNRYGLDDKVRHQSEFYDGYG